MKRRTRDIVIVMILGLFVTLLLASCGSTRRGEPIAGRPLPLQSPHLQNGQKLYMEKCHLCHPGGEAGLGPALNNKRLPKFLIRFQVRHGLGAMPGFSSEDISDEQLDDILTYLKALRAQER